MKITFTPEEFGEFVETKLYDFVRDIVPDRFSIIEWGIRKDGKIEPEGIQSLMHIDCFKGDRECIEVVIERIGTDS